MIKKETIVLLAEKALEGSDRFLVDVVIRPVNNITIIMDSDTYVSVDHCVEMTRFIESALDRDKEDYELKVSSAGLDYPFSMIRQYRKYTGKMIWLTGNENKKSLVKLLDVETGSISFQNVKKGKSRNKPVIIEEEIFKMSFDSIVEAKPYIEF